MVGQFPGSAVQKKNLFPAALIYSSGSKVIVKNWKSYKNNTSGNIRTTQTKIVQLFSKLVATSSFNKNLHTEAFMWSHFSMKAS